MTDKTQTATRPFSDARISALKEALSDHLERIKRPINQEIRNYPMPAAGCDAQFNHLIEERRRLAEELSRLAALEDAGMIDEFMDASAFIDDNAARNFRQSHAALFS